MTLPDERYRSVLWAERFLRELAHDTKKYPRVPRAVREEAARVLRHYPLQFDMDLAADLAPHVFESPRKIEALTRWIVQGQRTVEENLEVTMPLNQLDKDSN